MFAAAGVAATATFLVLPSGGVAQGVVFVSLNAAAVAALYVRMASGALAGGWRVLVGSQVLYLAAVTVWYFAPLVGRVLPYPSVLDLTFWVTYCGWGVFLVGVSRRRVTGDSGVAWEAVAASFGLAVVAWPVLLEPALHTVGVSGSERAALVAYPMLLLVVASIGVRVAIVSRGLSGIDGLVVAWLALELVGDIWYSFASSHGSFRLGHPWFAAWMLSYTAFGALVLHRGAAALVGPATQPRHPSPFVQVAVLGTIFAGALAAIAAQAPDALQAPASGMAITAGAGMGIVLVRLGRTSRNLSVEHDLRNKIELAYAEAEHLATHDALTGVANRAAFDTLLPRALARRRHQGRSAGLLAIDLDSFKAVNDTYGHPVGDALLQITAARLTEMVRPADLVARLGGDEFAVAIDDGDVHTLLLLADRVVAALQEPAEIRSVTIVPSVSVGVHAIARDETPELAISRADAAMYSAKGAGGGFEMFDATRHQQFIDRFGVELALRAAVVRDELVLHYQPVFDLASRLVVGAEALVRWNHPSRGLVNPGEFIEVAEASGAIVDVGRWVTRQACRDAQAWQTLPGGAGVGVAVNLSRRQLQSLTVVDHPRNPRLDGPRPKPRHLRGHRDRADD